MMVMVMVMAMMMMMMMTMMMAVVMVVVVMVMHKCEQLLACAESLVFLLDIFNQSYL